MLRQQILLPAVLLAGGLSACGGTGTLLPPTLATSPTPPPLTPIPTSQHLAGASTATPTATTPVTPSATLTPIPTAALIPSATPTYAILRGKINVERASCRYGPGAMYLFLYGLRQGATQDVIGRTDTGSWVLTQSHGDSTRCWVRTDLLDLNGDVLSVEMVYPEEYDLPVSPYYPPPYTASAARNGDQVTITWTAQSLRAGDRESDTSPLFVVETWVCVDGHLVFTPIGADLEIATVTDERGCAEPSHGRVFLAEKHGYAGPTEIPWPPPAP